MENSEWFWLAVCASGFLVGCSCWAALYCLDLTEGKGVSLGVIGYIFIFSTIGYFSFNLYKPFNIWLDNLK